MALFLASSNFRAVFVLILLLRGSGIPSAESFQESCSSTADTCTSLLGYTSPSEQRLQTIASLFSVDAMAVFGANDFDPTEADPENVIIQATQFLKIPVTCSCIDKLHHRVNSTVYTVAPGDYLSKIADTYGDLITYQEIAAANNIADPTKIFPGQKFVIPLPCACLNGAYNNHPVVALAYVISPGDTLYEIAAKSGAEVAEIQQLNGLNSSKIIKGTVLEIPVPGCSSSFAPTATDYGLIVARGSYSITADHCVQCSCASNSSDLYCSRAPDMVSGSCPKMDCKGTQLEIGQMQSKPLSKNCNVTSCLYEGFEGNAILSRTQRTQQTVCPAPMHAPAYVPIYSGPSSLAPASAPPPPSSTAPSSSQTILPPSPMSSTAKAPNGAQPSLGLHSYGISTSLATLSILIGLQLRF